MVSEYGWRARFAAQGGPGIGPGGVAGTPYTQALARAA